MSVAITIRDVPDETRDELAARAARAGKSLQEYLRACSSMLLRGRRSPTSSREPAHASTRRGFGSTPSRSSPRATPTSVTPASSVTRRRLSPSCSTEAPTGSGPPRRSRSISLAAPEGASCPSRSPTCCGARRGGGILVGRDQAAQAHADLLDLTVRWPRPSSLLAARAWELRANLSSYDASYVALGETSWAPRSRRSTTASPVPLAFAAPWQRPDRHAPSATRPPPPWLSSFSMKLGRMLAGSALLILAAFVVTACASEEKAAEATGDTASRRCSPHRAPTGAAPAGRRLNRHHRPRSGHRRRRARAVSWPSSPTRTAWCRASPPAALRRREGRPRRVVGAGKA